jgi:multidrug resistance efflux pump
VGVEDQRMKAFLAAVAVAVIVAYGAYYVLNSTYEMASSDAYTTTGVRL